jgi:hypothetical protein
MKQTVPNQNKNKHRFNLEQHEKNSPMQLPSRNVKMNFVPVKNLFLLLVSIIVFTSFTGGDTYVTQQYIPILMLRDDLENSIRFEAPRDFQELGKIYTKDGYIFISQHYKGVHVIDNRDPLKPMNIGFINVPGCLDIAIKGNSMYVDNAVDLVTIDISNSSAPTVTSRCKDVFPELLPPDKSYIPSPYTKKKRPLNTVIVEWRKTDIPVRYDME